MSEEPLSEPLAAAFRLPDVYDELKPRLGKAAMINGLEFSNVTMHKLEVQARLQFRSGIRLLEDEWLAYGSESHLRGVLECLAHISLVARAGRA